MFIIHRVKSTDRSLIVYLVEVQGGDGACGERGEQLAWRASARRPACHARDAGRRA